MSPPPPETRRLRRLILQVVLLGLLAQLAVWLLVSDREPVVELSAMVDALGWAQGLPLVAVMLALTFFGDLVAVPIRHEDEQTEELTLFEAAVVICALLLPLQWALVVPVAATLLTSLVRRRQPMKALFNAGNLAACTAVLVAILHLCAQGSNGMSWQVVTGLCLGALAFTSLNLIALSRVLAIVGNDDPWSVVKHGARMAGVTAVGSVALGASTVTLAWAAPALIPLTVMPAAALGFAYRAAALEVEERTMSRRLLELSHVLAGRLQADEVLEQFLGLSRQAFGADLALAVLLDEDAADAVPVTIVRGSNGESMTRTPTLAELGLLGRGQTATLVDEDLPGDWRQAALAPLEADGRRLGVVVLAMRDNSRRLGGRQLSLLTPLTSALGVALRGAAHLQQLTEEKSKLQAVVDQSSDGILVLDGEGVVLLWSPALTDLTGTAEKEAVGRPLSASLRTTVDGTECDPFAAGRDLLTPEAPQATVELVLHRDNEQRVVRCAHAGVFADGELARDVVIVHDITRERQVERLKADFIATVSHELRTPVTPIKGYADLLRRRGDAMTPERRIECLDVISDRCDHLVRLVEDLLLASRISATEGSATAQVELGSGDLVALVRRAAGDFGLDGDRVHLALPADPVPVACDPTRVIQVLTNLIGNALKYSPAGSPVEVTFVVDGERARVDVIDHGRGIPADQLERVFDKFHRVEDPMRMTTGGTGLGLYIARQLATAMGGTLECASTLGAGSVFSFSLNRAGSTTLVPEPRDDTSHAQDATISPR